MRKLKKKFRKLKKIIPGGDKLKHPIKTSILVKIPIKKKLGRWCEYYEGRLPYPIECSTNKSMPVSEIFKKKKRTIIRDTSNCPTCKRNVEWDSWKKGSWDKVKKAIAQGEDLTDVQESFNIKER